MTNIPPPAGRVSMKTIPLFLAVLYSVSQAPAREPAVPAASAAGNAIPTVEQRAQAGDSAAMAELGREFLHGTRRAKDPAQAMRWFLKGARAGNALSQVGVGFLLSNGIGCPVDKTGAGEWFRRAADQGNAKGQHNLAVLLKEGFLGPGKMPEALEWFTKAAEQGLVESQAMLGEMYYLSADGVSQDFARAAVWLEKAAAAGHNPSRTGYGSMLRFGNKIPADKARALALFREAAEEGYAKAMCQLADMLAGGEGTERQPVRAAAWYFKAASLDEDAGKTGWAEMEKTLTAEQLAEARRIAAEG